MAKVAQEVRRVRSSRPGAETAAEREARVDLAACYRLAARYGWTDLIYTHISARVPGEDGHFLLNPFGWMFDEITASSLVKVDLEGNKVDDSPHRIHRAGFVIHSAIHAARPDAGCVIHSHTRAGMAVSMMECGLLPLTQHAMLFHGRVGYHASEGFALALDERRRLAEDLGDKPILILRNHGTLVAGATVAQAFSMMWHLEKAMQAQVDAMASGTPLSQPGAGVADAIAARGFSNARIDEYSEGQSPLGRLEWPALLRMLDREDPSFRD
ncbi:MAG: class II aldolase/adducin family protein [Burkholderiales bacterium]|nr:class II aldolase/adducin family protein [Burkholderiales bacterium]